MMENLIDDLSKLTTIPAEYLNRLITKCEWCVCDYVDTNILEKSSNIVEFDIGLGTISIILDDNKLIYRFVPSKSLEKSVINTIKNNSNPLKLTFEKNLVNKITEVYKEMI